MKGTRQQMALRGELPKSRSGPTGTRRFFDSDFQDVIHLVIAALRFKSDTLCFFFRSRKRAAGNRGDLYTPLVAWRVCKDRHFFQSAGISKYEFNSEPFASRIRHT